MQINAYYFTNIHLQKCILPRRTWLRANWCNSNKSANRLYWQRIHRICWQVKNLILYVTTMMAWLESIDLTRCFHVAQAFENKSDNTKRSVSITLFLMHSKLSLLHFRLAMAKYLLSDMVSQNLQSSLSSPNFHSWSSFHKKRTIRKSILVTNVGIVAWAVKLQIVVNQVFFWCLSWKLKIIYWTTFQIVPWSYQKSNLWGVAWLLQNTDLYEMIHMRGDLTVTKYWFIW